MSYQRKTSNQAELSEACSRAAKSRRANRGGRPRLAYNAEPPRTVRVRACDHAVLTNLARRNGCTISLAFHAVMGRLVKGGKIQPNRDLIPEGHEAAFDDLG